MFVGGGLKEGNRSGSDRSVGDPGDLVGDNEMDSESKGKAHADGDRPDDNRIIGKGGSGDPEYLVGKGGSGDPEYLVGQDNGMVVAEDDNGMASESKGKERADEDPSDGSIFGKGGGGLVAREDEKKAAFSVEGGGADLFGKGLEVMNEMSPHDLADGLSPIPYSNITSGYKVLGNTSNGDVISDRIADPSTVEETEVKIAKSISTGKRADACTISCDECNDISAEASVPKDLTGCDIANDCTGTETEVEDGVIGLACLSYTLDSTPDIQDKKVVAVIDPKLVQSQDSISKHKGKKVVLDPKLLEFKEQFYHKYPIFTGVSGSKKIDRIRSLSADLKKISYQSEESARGGLVIQDDDSAPWIRTSRKENWKHGIQPVVRQGVVALPSAEICGNIEVDQINIILGRTYTDICSILELRHNLAPSIESLGDEGLRIDKEMKETVHRYRTGARKLRSEIVALGGRPLNEPIEYWLYKYSNVRL